MPQEGTVVATVFAPIMFPPASVLVFKQVPLGITFSTIILSSFSFSLQLCS